MVNEKIDGLLVVTGAAGELDEHDAEIFVTHMVHLCADDLGIDFEKPCSLGKQGLVGGIAGKPQPQQRRHAAFVDSRHPLPVMLRDLHMQRRADERPRQFGFRIGKIPRSPALFPPASPG